MRGFRGFFAVVLAVTGFGCSKVDIGLTSIKQTSTPPVSPPATPPVWAAPTVTQGQCDAIFKAPGGWTINDSNTGLYFVCGAFDTLNENFVLAPNMKFFFPVGVNPSTGSAWIMTISTDNLYQTQNGLNPQFADQNATKAMLDLYDANLQTTQGKIIYAQTQGPSNILSPIQKGVVYSVTTPSTEGDYEYQVQAQNKYGVGPVKTIHIKIKKSGIDPTSSPNCPGYTNTVVMDLDQFGGGRMLSRYSGAFGPNSALVVKFTLHNNAMLNIGAMGNGWIYSDKHGNLSSRPCDFETNQNTFYNHTTNDSFYSGVYFGNDLIGGQRTLYLNLANDAGPTGCGQMGYTDCAIHIDYNYLFKPTAAEFGNVLNYKADWGLSCDGSGSSRRTVTTNWNSSTNQYDVVSCIDESIILDPYYH